MTEIMMTVNCRDFERLWNEQLDDRDNPAPRYQAALAVHATTCVRCGEIARRYEVLRRALSARGPGPLPAEDFADRVLRAHAETRSDRVVSSIRAPNAAWWSVAAAVLLLALGALTLRPSLRPDATVERKIVRHSPLKPEPLPRPLSVALADATSATLDLAWETSAPAARVGRRVLASAAGPRFEGLDPALPSVPSADVLPSVGDGFPQSVRPLSGSARHAFSFLLPSGVVEAGSESPVDRGA